MANIQISNPDIIQFLGIYDSMIQNFENRANPVSDNDNYIFYVSKNNIVSEKIINSITIKDVIYYYTINSFYDTSNNRVIKTVLVYDTNFNSEDIIDFASTHTNIPRSILERVHYYLWNGSHLNIAPIVNRQLINYHHTEYIINQTDSRLPLVNVKRNWCKFSIPDYIQNKQFTTCINEIPPKIFDQVQGRQLSSLDGEYILNTMLNLPLPRDYIGSGINDIKLNKISKKYKSIKNKTSKLTVKKESQLDLFKQKLVDYIQIIAYQNNIKLLNNTAVICNPFKVNSYGIIILNVNIEIDDFTKSESVFKNKKCKGYFKTVFKVKEIYQMTK